jgi:hypothetical protein
MNLEHFPKPMAVYNSGGWVVDSMSTDRAHGGAIVLVDNELNVASLRMYNETKDRSAAPVKVEAVGNGTGNPLYEQVKDLVQPDREPWLTFSRVAAENVDVYHKRFGDRLKLVRRIRPNHIRARNAA